jgi:hypothetical protein
MKPFFADTEIVRLPAKAALANLISERKDSPAPSDERRESMLLQVIEALVFTFTVLGLCQTIGRHSG